MVSFQLGPLHGNRVLGLDRDLGLRCGRGKGFFGHGNLKIQVRGFLFGHHDRSQC